MICEKDITTCCLISYFLWVVCLVRQISLALLYRRHGNSFVPEGDSVTSTMSFIWALSKETSSSKLKRLSKVSLPFWLVQVSPENSVLLSASTSESKDFSFTHETRLSEVRRVISNEVNEPKDIPSIVEKALTMMDEMETVVRTIRNLYNPEAIAAVGQYVQEMEPSDTPNRVEQEFSSQHALSESEAFQKIRDELLARVDRMEELKALVSDQLRSHLRVLENIVAMEKRKWEERTRAMKSSTEIATHDLESKKSEQIYSLKGQYRKQLSAKTAEFARASTDIESYFTYLLDHVRDTRTIIAQKQDDIESAVEEYQKLAKYLTDALPRFEEILEALNEKSAEVLDDAKKYNETLTSRTGAAAASVESEIDDRKQRVVQLEHERHESESELDELLEKVITSIDRIEGRIKRRLLEHQGEVLDLQRATLRNDAIRSIAPLTHLDIFFIVAEYSDHSQEIFTPGLTPEDRFSIPISHQSMNRSLHEFVKDALLHLQESDSSFRTNLDKAIVTGDILEDTETLTLVEHGLKELQLRQLLEEGTYEQAHRSLLRCMGRI